MDGLSTSSDDPALALMRLLGKRQVTPAHVAALRASELGLGVRTVAQAEAMFTLERDVATCRAWGDFLVETMLDYLVWDERPAGCLSEARARWLCDQVGESPSPACMALLIAVLDEAADVPAWFPQAVQVRARMVFAQSATAPSSVAA